MSFLLVVFSVNMLSILGVEPDKRRFMGRFWSWLHCNGNGKTNNSTVTQRLTIITDWLYVKDLFGIYREGTSSLAVLSYTTAATRYTKTH
jgi:hypothetical protein